MLKHTHITETRIEKALPRIQTQIFPESAPVSVAAWHVGGEPVPFAKALQATYEPFAIGQPWGPSWDTSWFRVTGEVPESWAGREVHLLFSLTDVGREGFTAEGLVYRDGKIVRAVNRARNDIEVAAKAQPGEKFEFYIEGAANKSREDGDSAVYGPDPLFKLAQAEIAYINRAAFEFYYDFQVASEAMLVLPEGQRRAELCRALNDALNVWRQDDPSTIPAARDVLRPIYAKRNGDTAHSLSAVGNAHIDTAWLWPIRETIRKCARTFSTTLDYMERYPEYIFACSQGVQYALVKAHYPELWERIKAKAKTGQWEVVGSMWVEMDCNLASGESLIRQVLYGKQFFLKEFGYETKDAWVPDVFGYSAAMPQIFKGCDIDYFLTQKISWNQINKFPHHTFLWEGIDGSRVFTHFPPADTYIARVSPQEMNYAVQNFQDHGRASRSMYLFGHGDGGGGPDIGMLERARRLQDFDGLPKLTVERTTDFWAKAKADARDLPVWVGELYLELHRGTYTSQAFVKRANRQAEFLLRDAEFADVLSRVLVPDRQEAAANPDRAVYDVTGLDAADPGQHAHALERAWKLVLLNQFHDIIPGSSIDWVYKDARKDYQVINELGQTVLLDSMEHLVSRVDFSGFADPLLVMNSLNWDREAIMDPDDSGQLIRVKVPACGYAVAEFMGGEPLEAAAVKVTETAGEVVLDNGILRASIGRKDGLLKSLYDLTNDREVLAAGQFGNLFQLHEDRPNAWDAWDVDPFYNETVTSLDGDATVTAAAGASPLRGTVRVVREFGASRIEQEITLDAGANRLDFRTKVEWQEDHKFLKVAFPVNVHSSRATYEIQFGHTERPTHYNTSWDVARFEVCAHKWADLSEADYGVALLNDCKYGYDIHGNVMRLSLLKAATKPDPKADRGTHHFTYALLPHAGDFRQGRVIEEAYELNVPLHSASPVKSAIGQGDLPAAQSFFTVDRPGVIIESIKRAENGEGFIVRFYEAYGSRGLATIRTSLPVKSVEVCNMLERKLADKELSADGAVTHEVRPFGIETLRFRV